MTDSVSQWMSGQQGEGGDCKVLRKKAPRFECDNIIDITHARGTLEKRFSIDSNWLLSPSSSSLDFFYVLVVKGSKEELIKVALLFALCTQQNVPITTVTPSKLSFDYFGSIAKSTFHAIALEYALPAQSRKEIAVRAIKVGTFYFLHQ